jgi:UDP-N-acetylmuramoylalanine--D-glutamate ligase
MSQFQLENVRGKRIVLLGAGREGYSTLSFLRRVGLEDSVTIADKDPTANLAYDWSAQGKVQYRLGPDYLSALELAQVVLRSPGISPEVITDRTSSVFTNSGIFLSYAAPFTVGVTGTKGKSTTSSLIHRVICARHNAALVGNIGSPALDSLDLSAKPPQAPIRFVEELSSFQLCDIGISPHVAVIQNIVPEHLDYHRSFENYVDAKSNIARYQTERDVIVFNPQFDIPRSITELSAARKIEFGIDRCGRREGCWIEGDRIVCHIEQCGELTCAIEEVPLLGKFNLLNTMPALIIGLLFGLNPEEILSAVRSFTPLNHRLQPVGEHQQVRFINDSLATVPDAAMAALDAFQDQSVVLVAGGYDRGLDYRPFAEKIERSNIRGLILFRPTGEKIASYLSGSEFPIEFATGMEDAVLRATRFAASGDIVLLSPGSASFGMFKDYADRGNQFTSAVQKISEHC